LYDDVVVVYLKLCSGSELRSARKFNVSKMSYILSLGAQNASAMNMYTQKHNCIHNFTARAQPFAASLAYCWLESWVLATTKW